MARVGLEGMVSGGSRNFSLGCSGLLASASPPERGRVCEGVFVSVCVCRCVCVCVCVCVREYDKEVCLPVRVK